MENNKRNQFIIIGVIVTLLLVVIGFIFYSIFDIEPVEEDKVYIKVNQIYSSDYQLKMLNENYFLGTYYDGKISIVINQEGKEIYNSLEDIAYDQIYPMQDGRYLIYKYADNILNAYIFDGERISHLYKIEDVENIKPILYQMEEKEYIIGFVNDLEIGSSLYYLDSNQKIDLGNKKLVSDIEDKNIIYTYNSEYFIVKEGSLYGVIDKGGSLLVACRYKDMVNTNRGQFLAMNDKNKYGIIDNSGDILVKFNYMVIARYGSYYLFVNHKKKMALYNEKLENVTGFQMDYDDLILYRFRNKENSIHLYTLEDSVLVLNNYHERFNGTDYNNHSLYIIKEGKIVNTIKQVGFACGDVFFSYDKKNFVTLYNQQLEKKATFLIEDMKKVNNISLVQEGIVKVTYYNTFDKEIVKYYNMSGEEQEFLLGDLEYSCADYSIRKIVEDGRNILNVYDEKEEKIYSIEGEYVEVIQEYMIVDNSIYKVVVTS